jgi:hypothetical protein
MSFAVIGMKKENVYSVVASGEYSELSNILDILKNDVDSNSVSLIEMDEAEYSEIKDDAEKINEKLSQYFNEDYFGNQMDDGTETDEVWDLT